MEQLDLAGQPSINQTPTTPLHIQEFFKQLSQMEKFEQLKVLTPHIEVSELYTSLMLSPAKTANENMIREWIKALLSINTQWSSHWAQKGASFDQVLALLNFEQAFALLSAGFRLSILLEKQEKTRPNSYSVYLTQCQLAQTAFKMRLENLFQVNPSRFQAILSTINFSQPMPEALKFDLSAVPYGLWQQLMAEHTLLAQERTRGLENQKINRWVKLTGVGLMGAGAIALALVKFLVPALPSLNKDESASTTSQPTNNLIIEPPKVQTTQPTNIPVPINKNYSETLNIMGFDRVIQAVALLAIGVIVYAFFSRRKARLEVENAKRVQENIEKKKRKKEEKAFKPTQIFDLPSPISYSERVTYFDNLTDSSKLFRSLAWAILQAKSDIQQADIPAIITTKPINNPVDLHFDNLDRGKLYRKYAWLGEAIRQLEEQPMSRPRCAIIHHTKHTVLLFINQNKPFLIYPLLNGNQIKSIAFHSFDSIDLLISFIKSKNFDFFANDSSTWYQVFTAHLTEAPEFASGFVSPETNAVSGSPRSVESTSTGEIRDFSEESKSDFSSTSTSSSSPSDSLFSSHEFSSDL